MSGIPPLAADARGISGLPGGTENISRRRCCASAGVVTRHPEGLLLEPFSAVSFRPMADMKDFDAGGIEAKEDDAVVAHSEPELEARRLQFDAAPVVR